MKPALRRIREFLNEWDPIGVNPSLRAEGRELNEYDDYASALQRASMLGPAEIQEAFAHFVESMGLEHDPEELSRLAEKFATWLEAGRQAGE